MTENTQETAARAPRPERRWLALVPLLVLVTVAAVWLFRTPRVHSVGGVGTEVEPSTRTAPVFAAGTVHIRRPAGDPVVDSGRKDLQGRTIGIACHTCHTTRPPNRETRSSSELDEFHQGLHVNHGNLACVACHHPDEGYQKLRLADGRALAYADVMQLCAQCHGPQFRDYQHGSHGGMTGHWDPRRGARQRNNCIDCHDPHTPRFPRVMPAPGPNDRFLKSEPRHGSNP